MGEHFEAGKLTTTTSWREYAKFTHELFDDFIEGVHEQYKEDRQKIKKWAKAAGIVVTSSSTYEQFHAQLKGEEGFAQIAEETRINVFDSLLAKAKEQDE